MHRRNALTATVAAGAGAAPSAGGVPSATADAAGAAGVGAKASTNCLRFVPGLAFTYSMIRRTVGDTEFCSKSR